MIGHFAGGRHGWDRPEDRTEGMNFVKPGDPTLAIVNDDSYGGKCKVKSLTGWAPTVAAIVHNLPS